MRDFRVRVASIASDRSALCRCALVSDRFEGVTASGSLRRP